VNDGDIAFPHFIAPIVKFNRRKKTNQRRNEEKDRRISTKELTYFMFTSFGLGFFHVRVRIKSGGRKPVLAPALFSSTSIARSY
jgi:hypothetical protein